MIINMYINEESADQTSFCSSCKKVPKSKRFRRTSLKQLVVLTWLLLATSLPTNTSAASLRQIRSLLSSSSGERRTKMCDASTNSAEKPFSTENTEGTIFRTIIAQCNETCDKAVSLAKQYSAEELQNDNYNATIVFSPNSIVTIPKTIHNATTDTVLPKGDEQVKETLIKLSEYLSIVQNGVKERHELAAKRKPESHEQLFQTLSEGINQIISELGYVMTYFDVKPVEVKSNPVRHENSEGETERKIYNWRIFHDYINLVEYTSDVMKYLEHKYCSTSTSN